MLLIKLLFGCSRFPQPQNLAMSKSELLQQNPMSPAEDNILNISFFITQEVCPEERTRDYIPNVTRTLPFFLQPADETGPF